MENTNGLYSVLKNRALMHNKAYDLNMKFFKSELERLNKQLLFVLKYNAKNIESREVLSLKIRSLKNQLNDLNSLNLSNESDIAYFSKALKKDEKIILDAEDAAYAPVPVISKKIEKQNIFTRLFQRTK